MLRKIAERVLMLSTGAALTLLLAYSLDEQSDDAKSIRSGVFSNEAYVNGLYTNMNLLSSQDIFAHVFGNLPGTVTVYPSENFYYFRFTGRGRTVSGALWLGVEKVDSGQIGFSFTRKPEQRDRHADAGRIPLHRDFGAADGVEVTRLDDFNIRVRYAGKTVDFALYRAPLRAGLTYSLRADEVFIGPCFDESGLRFDLLFNKNAGRLFWVLNEDHYVPEQFTQISVNVSVGERSEFAFFHDREHGRKILIGVHSLNVADNNWFDGPFDQMPDNYVRAKLTELRSYLALHHKVDQAGLDAYGFYGPDKRARLSATAYRRYSQRAGLAFADSLFMQYPDDYAQLLAGLTMSAQLP